jgi:zinc protease
MSTIGVTQGVTVRLSMPGPDDIVRRELDNGIVVLIRENHASPAVLVAGYLPVGAIDVPAEQAGLAALTAAALMRGTTRRTFEQIYHEIESVGAAVNLSAGGHTTRFGAKSLAADLGLLLDVLADAMCRPTFPEKEIARLQGQFLTFLQVRANDTASMANLAFQELAYPNGHPYSRSVRGYPETVCALSREDLVCFYQQGYGARGMTLCIVGAVQADEALAQVEAAFADWQGHTFTRDPLPDVSRPSGIIHQHVDMPDKRQTDVVMGAPGPARDAPDYVEAAVANAILGVFGMMGRLGQHLRDEQGLAYYVSSDLESGLGPGPWVVSAGVDPSNVEPIIQGIRAEIRLLRDVPVKAKELKDVQVYLVGSLPLSLETNEGVATTILSMEQYQLGLDFLMRYPEIIQTVTVDRVQATARHWLDPDCLAIGIAGPYVPGGVEWS